MTLSALQERFVAAYSADPRLSATDAYVLAKGEENVSDRAVASNSACQLLRHPKVAEAVKRNKERFFLGQQVVRDDIFQELQAIIKSPTTKAAEKLRAAELCCKLFGLL